MFTQRKILSVNEMRLFCGDTTVFIAPETEKPSRLLGFQLKSIAIGGEACMKTMRDCFWLWGENIGTHHMKDNGIDNPFNLPGENHMSPEEGLRYLDIPNMFRVVFQGLPAKPYDDEMLKLKDVNQVVWSICDYPNNGRVEDPDDDVAEVIRQAKKYSNITGVIMDDFFTNDYHFVKYKPEDLRRFKDALRAVDRDLKMWVVIYTRDFHLPVRPYLEIIDNITMWNWHGEMLDDLENHLKTLKGLGGQDKEYYAGCFPWDYGNARPLSRDRMLYQLDTYYKWMKNGDVKGMVFCSNTIADLGIENFELMRQWIKNVGDEVVPE